MHQLGRVQQKREYNQILMKTRFGGVFFGGGVDYKGSGIRFLWKTNAMWVVLPQYDHAKHVFAH